MIASMWAAFSSTRTARDGAWSGTRCPGHFRAPARRVRGDRRHRPPARRGWRRARRRPNGPRHATCIPPRRGPGTRWPPRRHANRPSTTTRSAPVRIGSSSSVVVLEVGDQTHRGRRVAPDDEGLARGHRVALELGTGWAARAHRLAPAAPRRWRAPRARTRPPCAPSAAATPRPRRSGPATATPCGRPRPSHKQLRNALAPIAITHRGRRQARPRLRARRWPKPTGRHWDTT